MRASDHGGERRAHGARSAGGRARARAGFTLFELLVVVLLIGIALAVATPAPRAARGAGARGDARAVAAACEGARQAAARRGEPVSVVLDRAAGAWWMVAGDGVAPGDTLRRGALARAAPANGAEAGRVVLSFAPTGAARGGPVAFVGEGVRHELVVSPWTGRVAVRAR